MAKRVKKGLWMELASNLQEYFPVVAEERAGTLKLSKPKLCEALVLTVAQCEALGMTTVLEDVPQEPWEQVQNAVLAVTGDVVIKRGEAMRIAALLNIESKEK